jgi:hypothetical protein
MLDLGPDRVEPVTPPARDGVDGLPGRPHVVSLSDVHGYLGAARSALRAVGDHPEFDPIVRVDDESRLHWAGGTDYVLVFNGDLVDRGPDNDGVIAMVERFVAEAPPGHVRITLGNHEWGVLFPAVVSWERWFSGQTDDDDRRGLCAAIERGHLVAAYGGYNVTYAHAGRNEEYDPPALNDRLVEVATRLADAIGAGSDDSVQREVLTEYDRILGTGGQGGRGPGAGLVWLDFRYLDPGAPPQVVGHTRQDQPVQKGSVICENVIRANQRNTGGEAVLVESPDRLVSLERTFDGRVHTHEFDLPAGRPREE